MDEILKPLLDWYESLTSIGQIILWCVWVYVVFRAYLFGANKRRNDKIDD